MYTCKISCLLVFQLLRYWSSTKRRRRRRRTWQNCEIPYYKYYIGLKDFVDFFSISLIFDMFFTSHKTYTVMIWTLERNQILQRILPFPCPEPVVVKRKTPTLISNNYQHNYYNTSTGTGIIIIIMLMLSFSQVSRLLQRNTKID